MEVWTCADSCTTTICHCLPFFNFLSNRNNTHPGDCVVEKAVSLLSREHCTARLEKVWGPGDGRPVSELKDIMDQLLKVRFEIG